MLLCYFDMVLQLYCVVFVTIVRKECHGNTLGHLIVTSSIMIIFVLSNSSMSHYHNNLSNIGITFHVDFRVLVLRYLNILIS